MLSREVLGLLAVLAIVLMVFLLRGLVTPPAPVEVDILAKVDKGSFLMGKGSMITLVNFMITKADGATQQKQLMVLSKRARGQPDKLIIAEPEGERLLAIGSKLFFFDHARGELEELTTDEGRRKGFAGSNISREEMALGFQLSRRYKAQEAGETKLEDKEASILQLTSKEEDVSYPVVKLFVDKQALILLKVEFFSGAGELQRVAEFSEFAQFEGDLLANKIRVKELLDGRSTEIEVLGRESQPLPDLLFAPEMLKTLKIRPPKK